jgi:formate dehydrogenase subunit gamma
MTKVFARLTAAFGIIVLLSAFVLAAPASAQPQPNSVNPSASVETEQQLLKELNRIQGLGTIPDVKSYVLEHPAGREWRKFRTVTLKWIAGIAIFSILALLTIFYLWHGSMRVEAGRSGRKIKRFSAFERFVHWLTASSFVVLAITGLNFTFGRSLLLPWIGLEAFSTWTEMGKYAHNYLSFAFTSGIVLMFLMWVARNLPTRADVEWIKRGGGMLGGGEPPAYKFNAGEKMIFWLAVFGGGSVAVSGFILLFPFYGTGIASMELAQIAHSVVGVLFIAAMFVHVYMGTIGMQGAFEGMATGEVDVNWAKSHHALWYEEEMNGKRADHVQVASNVRPLKPG